ncbi:MAG: hypothetical protein U9N41_00665 [Euryarchaeota archaeon]|nr:hypothetical protein [Euryarchaeota archaeon]
MRIRAVLITLMFFTMLFYPAAAEPRPTVMITDYNVYPEVLMPGDTGTITVTIQNRDTQSSETETTTTKTTSYESSTTATSTIRAEIETIRLSSRSRDIEWLREGVQRSEYYNIGALGPGESITISLPIKAAAHTSDGTYFPEVCIEVEKGENVRFPIPVKVASSDVKISADAPSSVTMGEITTVGLTVFNTRQNKIEAVRLVPMTKGVKFSPSEFPIGTMEPDELVNASFDIAIGDSFDQGENEIEFKVEYKNGDNNHESYCKIPIEVVHGYGVRLIASKFPSSIIIGEMVEIELDTVNTRSDEAKSAIVVPMTEELLYQPSEYYIGNMRPGDLYTAQFKIDTSNMKTGVNNLVFKVIYKDANGYQESDVCTLTLNAAAMDAAKTSTSLSGGFIIPIVVILVIIALGTVLYIRRRKREV